MTGTVLWCALINLKRKMTFTLLFFAASFFTANALFLARISASLLSLPDLAAVRMLYTALVAGLLALGVVFLVVLSFFHSLSRREELAVYRVQGAQTFDILLMNSLETLLVCTAGGIAGVLTMLLLTAAGLFDLPSFFVGMRGARLLRLVGAAGQAVFGVAALSLAATNFFTSRCLKGGVEDLLRGSP